MTTPGTVPNFTAEADAYLADIAAGELGDMSQRDALATFGQYMFAEGVRASKVRMSGCEDLLDELEMEAEQAGSGFREQSPQAHAAGDGEGDDGKEREHDE
ncbi:MAG TPA: hypothetical protein VGK73_32650 [Polyangiaceae bacterium]